MMGGNVATELTYLVAAILFILGLKGLNSPETARRGQLLAALGMLLAIVGTLIHHEIISFTWIIIGAIIGSIAGAVIAIWTPMTAMPERTALSHAFGALAAALVGVAEFYHGEGLDTIRMSAIGSEVLLGSLTFTGSMMAFGKLAGFLPGAPMTYKGQNIMNLSILGAAVAIVVYLVFVPTGALSSTLFYLMVVLALVFGVMLILPIGAADMPTVIAILNAYAGISAALLGIALESRILIVGGALDGASGFILSILMCKAMNRSFTNVLFGAFGKVVPAEEGAEERKTVTSYTPHDTAWILENAQSVIVVPGYGLAAAQAQHMIQDVAQRLMDRGVQVRYAIHPVAGRMPGHMNVLLAEANVPYDLLHDLDEINEDFKNTDVVVVVGANDVVNPAARHNKSSSLYGMPILNADQARTVIVLKRSLNPGFAGEDNELFYLDKTMMVFGDAKKTLTEVSNILKTAKAA
ncbi:MAG TPA: NAD(P)(+) transhydrogenase (Re/Si-specific) subunit beta [Thermodesulfobacteriota bacterium]|nr:NAD(P)(+) transhydrogenase (Re/Si-specific) subunit beta [Thermodesulfobacteriota bacterium]